jgi:hypothetical protein
MTDATLAPAAANYLAELEAALAAVDGATRDEILAGVREELVGLDAETVGTRIRELGDPEFIAAEARAAASASVASTRVPDAADAPPAPHAAAVASGVRGREPVWFSVLAALFVAIGGVVIPFVGALLGYVLMWLSTAWTRRQKLIATLAPLCLILIAGVVIAILRITSSSSGDGAVANPLMPAQYDLIASGMTLALLVLARRSWAARA